MICIAIVVVCLASVNKISELRAQSRELSYTEKALEQEIAQAKQETENLKAQENYMKTREYFEDQAKTKLGLVYPDEIVIKPAE